MYYAYILECADGTFYAGWALDPQKRLLVHNQGKGAKYTRARLPVQLRAVWCFETQQEAMRFERMLKTLPRQKKIAIIESGSLDHCEVTAPFSAQ